jgi:hypothetical protein
MNHRHKAGVLDLWLPGKGPGRASTGEGLARAGGLMAGLLSGCFLPSAAVRFETVALDALGPSFSYEQLRIMYNSLV